MYPRPFRYVRAESVGHALATLVEHGDASRVLAGGATLIPQMKYRTVNPEVLVDIADLDRELHFASVDADELRVGALVRHADIQRDGVADAQPIVGRVASLIADVQVRNMGTVVGGICAVEPTGDWVPVLLALRGRVVVRSAAGERTISSDDLVLDAFTTSLRPDELAIEMRLPVRGPRTGAAHQKLTIRVNAGIVSCSAAVTVDGDGAIADVGIALGSVERRPFRATAAEDLLEGGHAEPDALAEAGRVAVADVEAVSDARGEAAYRKAAGAALLGRAVAEAYGQATGGRR